MGDLFYASGLIPLLLMISFLLKIRNFNRVSEWYIKFEKVTGKVPKKSDYRTPDEYDIYTGVSFISIIDFVWMILGLLSNNWYVFLSLMLLSIIVNLSKKYINIILISNFLTFLLISVKIFVYLCLILNHFHFHYDIWKVLKSII